MIRVDWGALVLAYLAWGALCLFAGMAWATWDKRSEQPRSHQVHELERRLRWRGDAGSAFHDHPAVATKRLPYDRTREDVPI